MAWTAQDIPDQSGKRILVTGANSGLGFETALALAGKGAEVILTARDPRKGEDAVGRIREAVPGTRLEVRPLDLSDLTSVAALADALKDEGRTLDVLVNNAGIMMPPRGLTRQGFETQIGVNHLAHFALTLQLLDLLEGSADPRVVTVSSGLHARGHIAFDDLMGEKSYSPSGAYAQSKIANIYFGLELKRRADAAGIRLKSVICHPGYASTNLKTSGPSGFVRLLMPLANLLMAQSAANGALPTLYAATMPDVRSGEYFGPSGPAHMRGSPDRDDPVPRAKDEQIASRLWTMSEELTGTRWAQ